jgi:hypothetical protein
MTKRNGVDGPLSFPQAPRDPVSELLADPMLDPALRLKDIIRQVERAREEWTAEEAACDEIAEPEALREAQARVRTAFNRWHALQDLALKAESEVRRRSLEIPITGKWVEELTSTVEALKEQYDGLGPHYELLCENTARLTIRIRMMDESGRDVASSEMVEMHKLQIAYIGQLQRFTEAMKSQTVTKLTQEVAEAIIQIFERNFANLLPEQWKECITELRAMVEQAA